MKYKNLNSLGRAFRHGEVDRSEYIRQRRTLIDEITNRRTRADEGIGLDTIEREKTTIISDADSLANEGKNDQDNKRRDKQRRDNQRGQLRFK